MSGLDPGCKRYLFCQALDLRLEHRHRGAQIVDFGISLGEEVLSNPQFLFVHLRWYQAFTVWLCGKRKRVNADPEKIAYMRAKKHHCSRFRNFDTCDMRDLKISVN